MISLTHTTYSLLFTKPLVNAKGTITTRKGFWLCTEIDGVNYYGEAAPLQGFSTETFEDVTRYLSSHQRVIESYMSRGLSLQPTQTLDDLIEAFASIQTVFTAPPPSSLLFALDSILFQYWQRNSKQILGPVALNILASDMHQVKRGIQEGFKTVKIKIGVDIVKELQFLSEIREHWPQLSIRLDANQAFSSTEAQRHIPRYLSFNPEYIEEPTKDVEMTEALHQSTGVVLAADESVRNLSDLERILTYNLHKVIILKPMLCNGFYEIFTMIKIAESRNKQIILSTSLDSGLARRMYALIASRFLPGNTHGLATGFLLKHDDWSDDHLIHHGSYHPERIFRKNEIRLRLSSV